MYSPVVRCTDEQNRRSQFGDPYGCVLLVSEMVNYFFAVIYTGKRQKF